MRRRAGAIISAVALAAVSAVPGCTGDPYQTASVSGKVTTCEGKPAFGCEIFFSPVDAADETGRPAGSPGQASEGLVAEDGTFQLKLRAGEAVAGALIGRHRVFVRLPRTTPPKLTPDERASLSAEELKQVLAEIAAWKSPYPPIACAIDITPDEVEVVRGTNTFEFTLPPRTPGHSADSGKRRSPREN